MKKTLSATLMKLGIAPNTKGYQYLKDGISYCLNGNGSVRNLQKGVYRYLAEKHGSTVGAVERCIRTAIRTGWHHGDRTTADEIFGSTLQSENDHPTNSLYIAALTEWFSED